MCFYLVARKYGKIISKTVLGNKIANDLTEDTDLSKVFIKKEYIGEEEKEAFKKWYEQADWYGYDSEAKAMEQLNKRGDFKEEVLPTEFCGWFGNIEVMIEEAV